MGSHLSLTCSSCGETSKFSASRTQDSLVCTSCGRLFTGVRIEKFDGCVYILSNPSMPGLLKIGMTEHDAFERAKELSSATAVPEPYLVEAYITCSNPATNEAAVHRSLSNIRKPNREFFAVSLEDAVGVLEAVVGKRMDFQRQQRDAWSPPSTAGAKTYLRSRDSSPVDRAPVKFKITCSYCGQDHWFAHRTRPATCPSCGKPFGASVRAT